LEVGPPKPGRGWVVSATGIPSSLKIGIRLSV
jgi:hypothetical protein